MSTMIPSFFSRQHILYVLFFSCTSILANHITYARQETTQESAAVAETTREIYVKADGSFFETCTEKLQIKTELGRELYGTRRIFYNGETEKVSVLKAQTLAADGSSYLVEPKMIEDKPIASERHGFDQKRQILIAYPHTTPGSMAYCKLEKYTDKPVFPNHHTDTFYFGYSVEENQGSYVNLKSEIPLEIKVNDPEKALRVEQGKEGKLHTLKITLVKPVYHQLTHEPPTNQMQAEMLTWVTISTFKNLTGQSTIYSPKYEAVINAPLTPYMQRIKDAVQNTKGMVNQINQVTSLLNETVRYMGDWRTLKGMFVPRAFTEVENQRVGDCKDFSAATVAILRALGYQAHAAFVWRGTDYLPPKKTFGLIQANHAMVRVLTPEGKPLWIDPTNFVSMAEGIFPDIANRPVEVINGDKSYIDHIPAVDKTHARNNQYVTVEMRDANTLAITGDVTLSGEWAQGLTGSALVLSPDRIKEILLDTLTEKGWENGSLESKTDLRSRIVKPIRLRFACEQRGSIVHTNLGTGIKPRFLQWMFDLAEAPKDQVGVFWIQYPVGTLVRETLFKGFTAQNLESLKTTFSSPWFSIDRQCKNSQNGLVMKDTLVISKRAITLEERQSSEYKDMIKNLKSFLKKSVLILSQKRKKAGA